MAEIVEVKALAGDIRAEQHTQRIIQSAETLHQILLFGVGHSAMQNFQLVWLGFQVGGQLLLQPFQRFDALGEDKKAIGCVVDLPAEID